MKITTRLALLLLAVVLPAVKTPVLYAQFGAPVSGGAPLTTAPLPTVALDTSNTIGSLNVAAFDDKDRVLDDVEIHITRTAEAVAALNNKSPYLEPSTMQTFREALNVARQGDIALRQSLQTARRSTMEQWNEARAALTASYTAYADMLTKLEGTLKAPNEIPR